MYLFDSSLNRLALTPLNCFNKFSTSVTIAWFQCSLDTRYILGNIIGSSLSIFSSTKFMTASLLKSNKQRSATCVIIKRQIVNWVHFICSRSGTEWLAWKCELHKHFDNCLNNLSMIFLKRSCSIISRISSNSFKNMTSLKLHVLGQYLSRPSMIGSPKAGSFSMNCTIQ